MVPFIPNRRCIVLLDKNYFLHVKNAAAFQLRPKWAATVLWEMAPAAIPTFCGLLREKKFQHFFQTLNSILNKIWLEKVSLSFARKKNLNLSQKKCFLFISVGVGLTWLKRKQER